MRKPRLINSLGVIPGEREPKVRAREGDPGLDIVQDFQSRVPFPSRCSRNARPGMTTFFEGEM